MSARNSSLQSEIQEMLTRAEDAYNSGDYEAFVDSYLPSERATMVIDAPGVESRDGETTHVVRGIAAIRRFYADAPMFKADFDRPRLAYGPAYVDVLGKDIAWVVARMTMSGGDERVPRRGLTSMVVSRLNGRWHILHDHTQ